MTRCSGAKMVRLDAFGYVTKKPGTRCFFQEPEVWHLLDMVEKIVHANDTGYAVFASGQGRKVYFWAQGRAGSSPLTAGYRQACKHFELSKAFVGAS